MTSLLKLYSHSLFLFDIRRVMSQQACFADYYYKEGNEQNIETSKSISQICLMYTSSFLSSPISHGGGQICPPPVYPGKAQNWLGPEGQAFAAFILI